MKNSIKNYLKKVSDQTENKDLKIEPGDYVTLFYFGENSPIQGSYISEDEDVIILGIYTDSNKSDVIKTYAQENDGIVPTFSVYSKSNLKSITKSIKYAQKET